MTILLELKEKLKILYARYSFWIQPLLKFLLAMIVFTSINGMMGYMEFLDNIFVLLISCLLCALMPLNLIVVIGGLMITAHTFALGLEVGGITLALILIMYLLFFRFAPKEGLVFILTPAAFSFGMPAVVPLGAGLLGGASSAVPVCLGTFLYYYIGVIKDVVEPLKEAEKQDLLANIQELIGGVLDQKQMFVIIAAGALTVLVVSLIKKISVDYAWYIAIAVGGLAYIIAAAGSSIALGTDFPAGIVLVGTPGSCLAALILEFFFFHVDYRKTEYLQYQDDTYVYYVKAVPKETAAIGKDRKYGGQKRMPKTVGHPAGQDIERQNADDIGSGDLGGTDKSPKQKRAKAPQTDQQREVLKTREGYGDSRTGETHANSVIEKYGGNPEQKRQQNPGSEETPQTAGEHRRTEYMPLNDPYQGDDSAKTVSKVPDIDFEAKLEKSLRELEQNIK